MKPAERCMACCRTAEEAGGRRLTAQPLRGTRISDQLEKDSEQNFLCCIQLPPGHDHYLVVWGEADLLTGEVIERAKADYMRGLRPWFCQACVKRCCRLCDAPERRPAISDYVCDDGYILHCPSLGADTGCLNPKCNRFKDY